MRGDWAAAAAVRPRPPSAGDPRPGRGVPHAIPMYRPSGPRLVRCRAWSLHASDPPASPLNGTATRAQMLRAGAGRRPGPNVRPSAARSGATARPLSWYHGGEHACGERGGAGATTSRVGARSNAVGDRSHPCQHPLPRAHPPGLIVLRVAPRSGGRHLARIVDLFRTHRAHHSRLPVTFCAPTFTSPTTPGAPRTSRHCGCCRRSSFETGRGGRWWISAPSHAHATHVDSPWQLQLDASGGRRAATNPRGVARTSFPLEWVFHARGVGAGVLHRPLGRRLDRLGSIEDRGSRSASSTVTVRRVGAICALATGPVPVERLFTPSPDYVALGPRRTAAGVPHCAVATCGVCAVRWGMRRPGAGSPPCPPGSGAASGARRVPLRLVCARADQPTFPALQIERCATLWRLWGSRNGLPRVVLSAEDASAAAPPLLGSSRSCRSLNVSPSSV